MKKIHQMIKKKMKKKIEDQNLDQKMLMSSQPVFENEEEKQEEEEKDIIMNEKDTPDDKKEDEDEEDRGPEPGPKDVTDEVKKMVHDGYLKLQKSKDLHPIFKTEYCNYKKCIFL
eukprot:118552_1